MTVGSRVRDQLCVLRAGGLLAVCAALLLSSLKCGGDEKAAPRAEADAKFVIAGQCVSRQDFRTALSDVEIRLVAVSGLLNHSAEVARTTSDEGGAFRFENLEPPRVTRLNGLRYFLAAKAGTGPVNFMAISNLDEAQRVRFSVSKEAGSLKGRVVDERGKPIAGAGLEPYTGVSGVEAVPSAKTNSEGLFILRDLPVYRNRNGKSYGISIRITHPDYPETILNTDQLPGVATFTLRDGCRVTGVVRRSTTGEPLADAVVSAIPFESGSASEAQSVTDEEGRYRLNLLEGNYKVLLEDETFVAEAIADLECRNGGHVEVRPLSAGAGGWITGQVLNTDTGKPMALNPEGKRIALGLFGPSRPKGRLIYQHHLAEVDDGGRFRIRAAAGENFPFFCNLRGSRTAWNSSEQPAVIVEEGKETPCMMEFTPERTADQKMAAAYKVLDSLPKETDERVQAIIGEFRKLNHTVDECEIWCLLMRELVAIGKPAVLPLCREFEGTDQQRMMRRLAFALRAIGDPRAVPTLIRVLPKTLQPPMSDYGLIVADTELAAFMRKHGNGGRDRGQYFSFGRPVRETHSALMNLTKRKVDGRELFGMSRSKDLRSLARQEKFYFDAAQDWAEWWEANCQKFGVGESFSKVNLPPYTPRDLSDYPTGLGLTESAVVEGGKIGMVVTPIGDADKGASFFLDFDTGGALRWPDDLVPGDSSAKGIAAAKKWAGARGMDLMCVPAANADGNTRYTLIGIGLQLWEIDRFDAKNITKRVAKHELPEGRKVDGALLHYDPETKQQVGKIGSSFLYVTREQGLGVITITDFVTEARDITGSFGAPRGVGFHRGVRFDYHTIAR